MEASEEKLLLFAVDNNTGTLPLPPWKIIQALSMIYTAMRYSQCSYRLSHFAAYNIIFRVNSRSHTVLLPVTEYYVFHHTKLMLYRAMHPKMKLVSLR